MTAERCHIRELINQSEQGDFSLAQARVEPGVSTALHLLKDTLEIYYILEGKGEMVLDGKVIGTVEAGDNVMIPANTSQCIRNVGERDLIFLCWCQPRFVPACYVDLEE